MDILNMTNGIDREGWVTVAVVTLLTLLGNELRHVFGMVRRAKKYGERMTAAEAAEFRGQQILRKMRRVWKFASAWMTGYVAFMTLVTVVEKTVNEDEHLLRFGIAILASAAASVTLGFKVWISGRRTSGKGRYKVIKDIRVPMPVAVVAAIGTGCWVSVAPQLVSAGEWPDIPRLIRQASLLWMLVGLATGVVTACVLRWSGFVGLPVRRRRPAQVKKVKKTENGIESAEKVEKVEKTERDRLVDEVYDEYDESTWWVLDMNEEEAAAFNEARRAAEEAVSVL